MILVACLLLLLHTWKCLKVIICVDKVTCLLHVTFTQIKKESLNSILCQAKVQINEEEDINNALA